MTTGIWEVLGIAQTADERAIKRAYAARLKQHRPDDDPAAFQRLRQAFEDARSMAQYLRDDMKDEPEPRAAEAVPDTGISGLHEQPVIENVVDMPPTLEAAEKQARQLSLNLEPGTLAHMPPDASDATPALPLEQDISQQLYEEASEHARHLWEQLQAEQSEQQMTAWLARYLEQDWFVHVDARQFLEYALLHHATAGEQPSIRADVMRVVGNFFDWNPHSLYRRQQAWLITRFWRRYEFSMAWETIHAVNLEQPMLQRVVNMLRQPPRPWLFRLEALFRFKQVALLRQLFEHWDEHCPEIYHYLNEGSVAWWRHQVVGEQQAMMPLFDSTGTILAFVALVLALIVREQFQADAIMLLPLWGIAFAALYGGRIACRHFAVLSLPYRQRFWRTRDECLQHPAAIPAIIVLGLVDIGVLASLPPGLPLIVLAMLSYLMPYVFLRDGKEWWALNFLALPSLILVSLLESSVTNPVLLLHFGSICMIAGAWYGLIRLALARHWTQQQLATRIKYSNYLAMGLPFILLVLFT